MLENEEYNDEITKKIYMRYA